MLVDIYVTEGYDVRGEVGEDLGEGKDRVLAKGLWSYTLPCQNFRATPLIN